MDKLVKSIQGIVSGYFAAIVAIMGVIAVCNVCSFIYESVRSSSHGIEQKEALPHNFYDFETVYKGK